LATKLTSTIHKVASNEITITGEEPIITSRSQLDKLTVKELKTLMIEQGIPSRPGSKLKKDFIDCIWDYYQNDVGVDGFQDDDAVENKVSNGKSTVDASLASSTGRKKPAQMPPLDNVIPDETNEEPYKLTAKDHIVLDVLERYPPLHDAVIAGCLASERTTNNNNAAIETITKGNIEQCNLNALQYNIPSGLAEADMRQIYHPMLKNATQSDLDIIFVGTASCTPGMTRGVSCTALRLNWRSKKVYTEGNDIRDNRGAMGTWLFDCGEATQLSIQKTANVKAGKISKIFITHCHGTFSLWRVFNCLLCYSMPLHFLLIVMISFRRSQVMLAVINILMYDSR
jgi:ribonuclease Z